MKTFNKFLLLLLCLGSASILTAQSASTRFGQHARGCKTQQLSEQRRAEDPTVAPRRASIERQTQSFIASGGNLEAKATITIPVVFHIVWRKNFPAENIDNARIYEQIDILNKDFSLSNPNFSSVPNVFKTVAANPNIQFCLAKRDPNGNPTTGIEKRRVNRMTDWGFTEEVKLYSEGGLDAWDASKYLNIWVFALSEGIIGYAYYPGEAPPEYDGVALDYRVTGLSGPSYVPFDLGRTATHEVGHYLNLVHTWGDDNCGNDFVGDTPTQEQPNFGCPNFPSISCGNAPYGDNYNNYMDYTDDICMAMFTRGQKQRMLANFAPNGYRNSLLTSDGCVPVLNPCTKPANVSVVATTYEAIVSWQQLPNVEYRIDYRAVGAPNYTTTQPATSPYTITGLQPDWTYEYRVRRLCPNGSFEGTGWQEFTTPPTNCTDANEPNETLATARLITLSSPKHGTIESPTDKDNFMFTITPDNPTVYISLTSLAADYDIRLYGPGGRLAAASQRRGTTNELINYTATNYGTYYVQVYGYQGAFNLDNCYQLAVSNNLNLRGNAVVKVEEPTMTLVPNPTQNVVNVTLRNMVKGENTTLSLLNMAGQEVLRRAVAFEKTEEATEVENVQLHVADLPSGVYLLQVRNSEIMETKKLMILK